MNRQIYPISSSKSENDPQYVEGFKKLYLALGEIVKEHLEEEPHTRAKVNQALNSLATIAAYILVGCDDDEAIEFFEDCLELSYTQLREACDKEGGLPS
jgi:hypothetical protein